MRRRPVLSLARLRRRAATREIDLRTGPGDTARGGPGRWARHRSRQRGRVIRL